MEYLTTDYLKKLGFRKDTTCPINVNRWEFTKKEGAIRDYYCSITFNDNGTRTLYGIINFYSLDLYSSRFTFEFIKEHRKFDRNEISIEDFNNFINKDYDWH